MFGKLMSISDALMWRYFELLSFRAARRNRRAAPRVRRGPQSARREGAARAWRSSRASIRSRRREAARDEFDARFREGALPADIREVTLHANGAGLPIAQLAKQAGIVESTSEALRLIAQRGLKVDGDVVADKALVVASGATVIVQAGKRKFARVTVQLDP